MNHTRACLPDGGWISYQTTGMGEGTPLLLVHPLGRPTPSWSAFREELAEGRRVIEFEPRGMGHSSPAPRGETTRRMAQDMIDLLDHVGIERAHVFGVSMGGMLATYLAVDAAARVAKLVLASTVLRGVDASPSGRTRALEIARSVFAPPGAHHSSKLGLATLALAAFRHDARMSANRVIAPTLLLYGGKDALIDGHARRSLEKAIPRATVDVVASAGHDITFEEPLQTAARVNAFFNARTPAILRPRPLRRTTGAISAPDLRARRVHART